MRMFVALVPPTEVLENLGEFLDPRREADPSLRWTEPFQWHLTLAFLPEVGPSRLDDLMDRLTRAAARRGSIMVTLAGAGAFPGPDRARVLWIGATGDPPEALPRVAAGVRAAANKSGVAVEGGRFRPHLTVARLRRPEDATRWLRILEAYDGRSWRADSIELIESHLGEGPGGHPRYEPIATHRLAGDADLP